MEQPKRKQIRLKDYDYSKEGFYFVTLCTQNRQGIFDIEPSAVGNDLKCRSVFAKPNRTQMDKADRKQIYEHKN